VYFRLRLYELVLRQYVWNLTFHG